MPQAARFMGRLYIALEGFDFQVLDPPELIPVLRTLSDHLRQAADAS